MRLIEYYHAIQVLSRSVEPSRTSSDFKFYSYDVITQKIKTFSKITNGNHSLFFQDQSNGVGPVFLRWVWKITQGQGRHNSRSRSKSKNPAPFCYAHWSIVYVCRVWWRSVKNSRRRVGDPILSYSKKRPTAPLAVKSKNRNTPFCAPHRVLSCYPSSISIGRTIEDE